jgi:hypothetical protein
MGQEFCWWPYALGRAYMDQTGEGELDKELGV